ncbi:MAG: electron transporter RnfG [Betaproteobacteria bacterium HGW-Betaproteobacteria-11]|nr:MAG: electron transporter RnfG [Betaproteobacteria bacterium HGW-Betaproteobacteria-11]
MSEPLDIPPNAEAGALRIALRTAVILLAFTLAFTAFMSAAWQLTAKRIAISAEAEKLGLIGAVLAPSFYGNALLDDAIVLPPQAALGLDEEARLFRARKHGKPVALVFEAVARDGYAGPIRLLLAVSNDGRLLAVRVTRHKETPGLGDYIDPKKDRNKARPWITQFADLDFDRLPAERWRVKKDGGQFDQRAGATISARAVTNATRQALLWVLPRRDKLFALPSGTRFTDQGSPP